MVLGSLAMHGVAYAALASIQPPQHAPDMPPTEVAFAVVAPAPEEAEPVAPPPPKTQPEPEPEMVAAPPPRPARRRKAKRPRRPSPEPEDHELGEPDAAPEQAADPALQAIAPASEAETGLSVAGGAPAQGQAAGQGDDQVNRAGGAAPSQGKGVRKVDLNVLAKRWMKKVSQAVARAAVREYPRAARRARLQGDVWVTLEVDPLGRVLAATLKRSSGHECLDRAALAAVHGLARVPAPPGELHAYLRPLPVPIRYHLQ